MKSSDEDKRKRRWDCHRLERLEGASGELGAQKAKNANTTTTTEKLQKRLGAGANDESSRDRPLGVATLVASQIAAPIAKGYLRRRPCGAVRGWKWRHTNDRRFLPQMRVTIPSHSHEMMLNLKPVNQHRSVPCEHTGRPPRCAMRGCQNSTCVLRPQI